MSYLHLHFLTVDTAVGAVSSSAHLGGLVSVGVVDNCFRQIHTLSLSVGLNIRQQIKESLGRLLGPGDLVTRGLILLGHRVSANATSVFSERDGLFILKDVLKINLCLGNSLALDGLGNLTAVLEVHSDVSTPRLGACEEE
jgi:hypothetical protein